MSKRRRFLQDYQYLEDEDGKRRVVYTGKNYSLLLPKSRLIRPALFTLPFILAAVIIASGLDPNGTSGSPFIFFPIIVSVLPCAFILIGSLPAAIGKRVFNEREKYRSGNRVTVSIAAFAILHGISAAAGIVYQLGVIIENGKLEESTLLQLVFAVIGCAAALFYRRLYKKSVSFNPEGKTEG